MQRSEWIKSRVKGGSTWKAIERGLSIWNLLPTRIRRIIEDFRYWAGLLRVQKVTENESKVLVSISIEQHEHIETKGIESAPTVKEKPDEDQLGIGLKKKVHWGQLLLQMRVHD